MFLPAAEQRFLRRLALALAMFVSGFLPAMAGPAYFTRIWQVEQGLPQNKVTAVVQTHDGYLWVGTYNGLARFDGVHFTVFDDNNTPELRSSRITSLFESGDGTLWIGAESGDISEYRDGRFSAVPLRADWSGGKIYAITSENVSDIWLLNQAGELARVRDGKVLSPPSDLVSNVVSLARNEDGTVWVGRDGAVSALKDGRLTGRIFTNLYVQGFCAARGGGFWVACDGGIRKWKDGKWVTDSKRAPWGWNTVPSLIETSSGMLAGGTSGNGLWLIFPNSTNTPALHLDRTNGLPSDWVLSMCEDREGNLWCGTDEGLVLVRSSNVATVSPPDNWRSCPVLSVFPAPNGALWVGTEGAGLYRLQSGEWTNFDYPQGIRNPYVWSLAVDNEGKIWAGTWGGGLYEQKGDRFEIAPGLENFLIPAPALLFSSGYLWIGTPMGAARYQNGKLEQLKEIDGKPFGDVRAIAHDSSGVLWFGTAGRGLVRGENGKFRRFGKTDGLSSDFIECLHFGGDGTLWIGTFGGGLDRFKNGKFAVINRAQGLPNGVIGHIESDGRGYFWMSSYAGVLRARESELNRCADGEITHVPFLIYGTSEGMPTLECSEGLQSAGCKTADGRLWFATAKGLVSIDPSNVTTNSLPPPVVIESMLVDDHPFNAPFQIPPGRHRIEFEYTGLSFVAPEKVQFKCRLNNLDPEWVDVGAKRMVTYNYIPPGNYSFQVIACNNDGVWNETGARLKFEVLPYFWQTTWFFISGGIATALAAGGAVWFDTRRRMRRRIERTERQRDIERERSRIARDIHDDLGASLTRIVMLSESAHGDARLPQPVAINLNRIYRTARELTRAMDEIVWAVNPRHDRLDSLANYLSRFAHEYLSLAEIRCRLDVPLQLPSLPVAAEVRHNLFLAFKEAMHNIVKHASADEVRLELKLESSALILIVVDNGCGFDANDLSKSGTVEDPIARGNGLANMSRRLAEIHGMCDIASRPGKGTTVKFSVPFRF